jgi:uncharacterized protein (DUF1330 family)
VQTFDDHICCEQTRPSDVAIQAATVTGGTMGTSEVTGTRLAWIVSVIDRSRPSKAGDYPAISHQLFYRFEAAGRARAPQYGDVQERLAGDGAAQWVSTMEYVDLASAQEYYGAPEWLATADVRAAAYDRTIYVVQSRTVRATPVDYNAEVKVAERDMLTPLAWIVALARREDEAAVDALSKSLTDRDVEPLLDGDVVDFVEGRDDITRIAMWAFADVDAARRHRDAVPADGPTVYLVSPGAIMQRLQAERTDS